jgi:hypothetical protein
VTDQSAATTEAEFLAKLQRLAEDYRYSDEFIGLIVRNRWPRVYPGPRPFHEFLDEDDLAVMRMDEAE